MGSQAGALSAGAVVLVALCGIGASGCGSVAVYERGHLAHRTMNPDDAASGAQAHIYAIQEGAVGGTVGVASGCGCN
jgi:hypothetical protein